MVTTESEMVRKLVDDEKAESKFTSLQPTYEDSVPPDADDSWEYDD